MQAVITADIVNSTQLNPKIFTKLVEDIKEQYLKFGQIEFYRGDSFQALVKDATMALKIVVLSRLKAISYSEKTLIDIRQSISLGKVEGNINKLGSHIDDTFVNSGRTFDKLYDLTSDTFLLINSGNADYDFTFDIISRYTDNLISQMTAKQALAIYHLLSGKSQKEAAKVINITGATINQQIKAARYEELVDLIKKYETLTEKLTHYGK